MLINEDWDIFSKEIQDYETDRKLLNAILNTYSEEQLYIGIENGPYSWDMHWNLVKQEIKHGNRFFPDFKIKPEIFSLFKFQDKTISTGQIIYRARIGTHIEEKMKAPPAEKAVAGRANPRGISYLYCSTDPLTCVSEIRPWKGAKVTIAEMIVNKELVVLDLSNTKFSPFILENSEDIITVRMLVGNFSQDISQPINPEVAELDYLPTQYITEIIKRIGYDGIYFKSSLGLEYNIVIFDQNNVSVNNIEYDVVRGITYETDKHSNQKRDIEDDLPLNLFD